MFEARAAGGYRPGTARIGRPDQVLLWGHMTEHREAVLGNDGVPEGENHGRVDVGAPSQRQ